MNNEIPKMTEYSSEKFREPQLIKLLVKFSRI